LDNIENILNDSSDILSIEEENIISSNKSDNIKKTEPKKTNNSHDKLNTILCISPNHSTTIENTVIFLCKM